MKKVLKIVAGIAVVLVILLAAIPLFIDANKFKPRIEAAVNENMNADLEIGNLKLSLWGGINIKVDKLALSEKGSAGKKPVFLMNDATFELPYTSVFSGRPDVTIAVEKPQIFVVKGVDGVMNVAKLTKPAAPGQPGTSAPGEKPSGSEPSKGGAGGASASAVPFDLSFRIKDGYLVYEDLKAKTKTEVKGFTFNLNKFTLNKPFTFEFESALDIKQMKELTLRGPVEFSGESVIHMGASGFEKVDFKSTLDMTAILVKFSNLFHKNEKVPLIADVDLTASMGNLDLRKVNVKFGDAGVNVSGKVENFNAPVVNMSVASTDFNFQKWQDIIAPFKEYQMEGSSKFDLKLNGPVAKLAFAGQANLMGFGMKVPGIVPRLSDFKANLTFSNDTAVLKDTSLKLGNSDISMNGSIKNFAKPVVRFAVSSQLFDVDSMLPQKPAGSAKQASAGKADAPAQAESGGAGGAGGETDPGKAVAGPIDTMKKNPMMRGLDFLGQLKMKKIIVNKAELTNFDAEATFKDLVFNLKKASAQTFGGSMNFVSIIDFRGAQPAYSAGGDVSGLDVNAAITNQMPVAKDSLFGKMFSKFSVSGSGITKTAVKTNLKGQGNFRIDNGSFSGMAALKAVGEKLKSIPGAGDKLGGVNLSDKFRQLKSDFNISGGRFNILNMIGDMEQANTTVTGNGFVDFDMNLQLAGKLMAPVGGDIPPELKGPDGRVSLPYEIECKVNSPCLKMEQAGQLIAKAYLKKEGGAQLKKAAEKIENPQVKELLKKLPF